MPIRTRAGAPAYALGDTRAAGVRKLPRSERLAAVSPERQYAQALYRHLQGMPLKEIDFFINPRRVEMIERLIGPALRRAGAQVLNIACGPFAVEFYLKLDACDVTSFDREPKLATLHRELTSRGLISATSFTVADTADFVVDKTYDVVLINDLFYSRQIEFQAVLDRYGVSVKPGGLLYFDIQDLRAGPLWRAFGKDSEFRRYDLSAVEAAVRSAGFTVDAIAPALGIKGGLDGVLRRALWRLFGIANSYVFVARKL